MRFFKNNKGLTTIAIVFIIVGIVVVVGGAVGGVIGYNAYQEKKQQEQKQADEKKLEEDRNNAVNAYNDRINQIVASLNVEKNGTASIDNNEDMDAMTNAVNELNNITNEINNNSVLTQEQKDALNSSIESNKNSINGRIALVQSAKNVIKLNMDIEDLRHMSYGKLLEKYGNEIQEIPYAGMEIHYFIPSMGVEVAYPTTGGQKPKDNEYPKHVEGKLKNMVNNINNISPEELVEKMSYQGDNDGAYPSYAGIKKGNPTSPYAFPDDYAQINISIIIDQSSDTGTSGRLLIALDNNTIGPDSLTWWLQ